MFIKSDSACCVKVLSRGCEATHCCAPLVNQIHGVLQDFTHVGRGHVFHKANPVGDVLAKHGLNGSLELSVFETLSSFCFVAFAADAASTVLFRGM